jgi:RNA polymerase sigma-70 factor (ECF subfamily)
MSGHPLVSSLAIAVEERLSDRIAELFDSHHQRLYRLARRLTPSAEDALDLVQETFLRAARAPKRVPSGPDREEAWLVRVLINLRRDQWRKAAVQKRYDERMPGPRAQCYAEADHGSAVIARATVWRALDMLPPRRRAVIVMHELEGLAVSMIASQLGISVITVRWHLSVGRRDLTRILTSRRGDAHGKRV